MCQVWLDSKRLLAEDGWTCWLVEATFMHLAYIYIKCRYEVQQKYLTNPGIIQQGSKSLMKGWKEEEEIILGVCLSSHFSGSHNDLLSLKGKLVEYLEENIPCLKNIWNQGPAGKLFSSLELVEIFSYLSLPCICLCYIAWTWRLLQHPSLRVCHRTKNLDLEIFAVVIRGDDYVLWGPLGAAKEGRHQGWDLLCSSVCSTCPHGHTDQPPRAEG